MSRSTNICELAQSQPAPRPVRRRDNIDALVHAAAAGEQRAWAVLIGRFDATIRMVARRHGLSSADRDEVAQRTWLKLLLHLDGVRNYAALGEWLKTTARRECLRVLEASRREILADEPIPADESDGAAIEDHAVAAERREALHRALESVPPHERRVMRLMLDEPGMSYDEVSAALGIPRGSVGPTRGRCITRLRGDRQLARVAGPDVQATVRRKTPGHDLT